MDTPQSAIDSIIKAAEARRAEHDAVMEAVSGLRGRLFTAVAALCRELEARGTPGVALIDDGSGGPLNGLRFTWGHAHLVFAPHDEVALPPKSYNVKLRGRVGRLPLFHTEGPDATMGLVLRDYLVDAHGHWYFRGLGSAQHCEPIEAATAMAHAVGLFFDLNANLVEIWQDAAEVRAFDETGAGREIGFHA